MREGAVKARISTAAGTAEAEEAVAVEKKADRVKTGTPRLDDLLYGGIPFNSNVLFVGPAFVGKEIALLNFIAEGLKKASPSSSSRRPNCRSTLRRTSLRSCRRSSNTTSSASSAGSTARRRWHPASR